VWPLSQGKKKGLLRTLPHDRIEGKRLGGGADYIGQGERGQIEGSLSHWFGRKREKRVAGGFGKGSDWEDPFLGERG